MRLLLDLALTTNAVNIDYKKSLHDWNIKTGVNGSFQNNFANQPRIKPLIPNFNRVEFGTYGIVSYDLSDSFYRYGLRYDYSRVDAAILLEITMGGKRLRS
jgi:iron complex outermembrane receptor protein